MKRIGASIGLLLALAAHADPYVAITADGVSTAIGLAQGFTEANPLGLITIPARMAATAYAERLPDHQGQDVVDAIEAVSSGAAASNILLLARFAAGPIIGLVVGAISMSLNSEERDRWAACRRHKEIFPDTKDLPCATGSVH